MTATVPRPTTELLSHEHMAELLDATGKYRVLRRFEPQRVYTPEPDLTKGIGVKRALFLDLETTGLDTAHCAIIELGAVLFSFDLGGRIYEVERVVSAMEDPGFPIPPEITELTGITDADVAGRKIDDEEVKALAAAADIVIAYNAEFDRPISERRFPVFRDKHWACAMEEVPWPRFGARGRKHDYLAGEVLGLFHDAHRAVDDCLMGVHLLAVPRIPVTAGKPEEYPDTTIDASAPMWSPMHFLVESVRTPRTRLWAIDSPYPKKELLKAAKYRWSDGKDGRRKGWWKDVPKTQASLDAERAFLANEVYESNRPNIYVAKVSARDRYSVRA